MELEKNIVSLKGVGETIAKKFKLLDVETVNDLINYFPRRYDDFSSLSPISALKPGQVSIKAKITSAKGRYVRRGMHITEAIASDESGSVRLVWFNQPYRVESLKSHQEYFISGNFELSYQRFAVMNPSVELASDFPLNAARIVPVYRETKGLKSAAIRKIIASARNIIENLEETLPDQIIAENNLLDRSEAIMAMHFPKNMGRMEAAKKRLGFEEIFGLSLASLINKKQASAEKTHVIPFKEDLARQFVARLPFKLTDSQRKVVWQIYQDMQKDEPMNRLVEGDVGSGKTVVATMAALMAADHGYQAAFMAPTELLARQHADTLHSMLKSIGKEHEAILLIGSMKPAQKSAAHKQIKSGKAKFIIGTHALIAEKVDMHKLSLVIVDEQHRFGVEQRKKLQKKSGGTMPHVLTMTATPIPRTLALTLYGELDISIISEKPKGRLPVKTEIVSPNSRLQMYRKVDKEIAAGSQMFVVCPLIAESDMLQALSAERVYEGLAKSVFKHRRVGLLHGKMKADEKEKIMEQFVHKNLNILVSTTVVEVGVDVPNATIMLVEGAERFGLAQIHQLRGRVGRRGQQAYCYIVMSDSKAPSKRLKALENTTDGFKLAELDLEIRGPGAIYGRMQSGQLDLRVAKLTDVKLIESARNSAKDFIESKEQLANYPDLACQISNYRSITNLN
ncbi:ATP-dependent DNA helicase RecG [Candidatus Parcubacteria bacterium]|nr:ATP-dependent DNA helicase RecG [Candidatus Parcubacteria bacterium]